MSGTGLDETAMASTGRRRVQHAPHIDGARAHPTQQRDGALMSVHRARFDYPGVVHHAGQQCLLRACRHDHQSAVGANQPTVFYQGVQHALVDLHAGQARALESQRGRAARAHDDRAQLGSDHALVAHVLAQQRNIAAVGRVDRALVDDAARAIACEGACRPTQAVIPKVQRGGHQPPDIDLSILAKQDAVGVDQVHLSVGVQAPQDLTAIGIGNAVDGNGRCRGLHEVDRLWHADIETLPAQRQVLAGLVDGGGGARLGNGARPRSDLPACGCRLDESRRYCERRCSCRCHGRCKPGKFATRTFAPTPGLFSHSHPAIERLAPDQAKNVIQGAVAFHGDNLVRDTGVRIPLKRTGRAKRCGLSIVYHRN